MGTSDFRQIEWDVDLEDDLRQVVRLAVREDLDRGYDWTTVALVEPEQQGRADLVARCEGVVAGLRTLPVVLDEMQASLTCEPHVADGDAVTAGARLATITGSARDLLTCERTMLNLLGRLSGIATLTRQFVEEIAGTTARIYDTRKTTPGSRRLEKYAVRCGGGCNHRLGLFDAILIKDNHLAVAADARIEPAAAVRRCRMFLLQQPEELVGRPQLIEVEVDSLEQLRQVLPAGPDVVLLDNMSCDMLREAVAIRNQQAPQVDLEASGNVRLETVRTIALTGVDRISAGALTHSARTLDIGMDWQVVA